MVNLTQDELAELEKAALAQHIKRVCDQSEDFDYDIFEESHPENSDKAQSKLA